MKTLDTHHYTQPVDTIYRQDCEMLIHLALEEDAPNGDPSSALLPLKTEIKTFLLIAKEAGVMCGIQVIDFLCLIFFEKYKQEFHMSEPISIRTFLKDGESFMPQDSILELRGPFAAILRIERILLNFLQYLSGISTLSHEAVKNAPKGISILDTRKTIPGFRKLSKYATYCGGASNHRIHLSDMIMLKDNHLHEVSIISLINSLRIEYPSLSIVVEVDTNRRELLTEILEHEVDVILLDNFVYSELQELCSFIRSYTLQNSLRTPLIEASGAYKINDLQQFINLAPLGISMGCLTHSVKSIDFSLNLIK